MPQCILILSMLIKKSKQLFQAEIYPSVSWHTMQLTAVSSDRANARQEAKQRREAVLAEWAFQCQLTVGMNRGKLCMQLHSCAAAQLHSCTAATADHERRVTGTKSMKNAQGELCWWYGGVRKSVTSTVLKIPWLLKSLKQRQLLDGISQRLSKM